MAYTRTDMMYWVKVRGTYKTKITLFQFLLIFAQIHGGHRTKSYITSVYIVRRISAIAAKARQEAAASSCLA